jgi:hypothetical protein
MVALLWALSSRYNANGLIHLPLHLSFDVVLCRMRVACWLSTRDC